MKKLSILLIAASAFSVVFYSCKKSATAPLTINGVSFETTSYRDTLIKSIRTIVTLPGGFSGPRDTTIIGLKTMDITAVDGSGNTITLQVYDWRDSVIGTGFRPGTYNFNFTGNCNNSNTYCDGAYALYSADYYGGSGSSSTGFVNITSCDSINHKISGTFSGTPIDNSGNGLTLVNGNFSNIGYVVAP